MYVFKNYKDFHRAIGVRKGVFSIENKIEVQHCRFEDGLGLFTCNEFLAPVIFRNCEFLQDELFVSTNLKDILIIENCVFHGNLQVVGSAFHKQVKIEHCVFKGKFSLLDAIFYGNTSFLHTDFQGGSNLFGRDDEGNAGKAEFYKELIF